MRSATRASEAPQTLSPWSVAQIERLGALAASPQDWLASGERTAPARRAAFGSGAPSDQCAPPGDPLAFVRTRVDPLLDAFLRERSRDVETLDPALAPVTRAIRELVAAGGKRLRPAFVYWGHRAAGGVDDRGIVPVAAAVELLHTFALLHDDVMDRSETRRGSTAAHRALASEHRRGAWRGDPDWFGVSAAILAGDLTFVWADDLFEQSPAAPLALARARRGFSTLRAEVMAGQYLDLRLAALPCPDEASAQHVALLKSGRYTVTRPLQLGVALATGDPDPALTDALTTYGDAVGVAFQLRDDVLGLFGDPAETGKSCVDDLREGKRTLLVLRALARRVRARAACCEVRSAIPTSTTTMRTAAARSSPIRARSRRSRRCCGPTMPRRAPRWSRCPSRRVWPSKPLLRSPSSGNVEHAPHRRRRRRGPRRTRRGLPSRGHVDTT